jgi:hypothetical protein
MTVAFAHGYLRAKERLINAGFDDEITWAEGLADVEPSDPYVLRETAWVIVNSGFRYAVARKLWPPLSVAFRDWNPWAINETCRSKALAVLNHQGKIGAILTIAGLVRDGGARAIVEDAKDPPKLCRLPWIGKITCWHLAKVLGVDCVKPDVHLQRAAAASGHDSPIALCTDIKMATGERLTVIDSVLWRYGEQRAAHGWPDWAELWRCTI